MVRPERMSVSGRAFEGWFGRNAVFVLMGEVTLCLGLGFYRLGRKSLWVDEGYTAMATSRGVSGVIHVAHTFDSNMVGYNLCLCVWRMVGSSEAALRSLSVVATAAAVVAVFLVASHLSGKTTGLIAGFLLAVAPFAVRYAQEVRSYAFLLLMVTLASYCFVVGIEQRDSRWLMLYAATAAASCYAHLFAGFVILAQATSLFFLGRPNIPVRQLVKAGVALAVFLVPLGYFVLSARQSVGTGSSPTLDNSLSVLSSVGGGTYLLVVLGGLSLVPMVMTWRTLRTYGPSLETWRLAFVVTWLVVSYVAALASALLVEPNWVARYLIIILPALAIAAALGIRQITDLRLVIALLVVITVLAGFQINDWYKAPSIENWRRVTAYVTASSTPADGIVFCVPEARAPFEYYVLQRPPETRPHPLSPPGPWTHGLHITDVTAHATSAWRAAPKHIWVVSLYAGHQRGACDLSKSMQGRTRVTSQVLGNVLVERYDRD